MASLIQLKNIDKIYGDKVKNQVLFDVSLEVEESSFNSIIGQSGSGKSTLMNIIGTLDQPTRGQVFIDGRDTSRMTKNELAILRNETIGFIFQFHHLLPEFSVLENVLMPFRIKNNNKITKEAKERAEYLIDMVGLTKVKNKGSTEISGGQQQRAAIARSLINEPKLILGDEPTGNLDSETAQTVYDLMRDINKKLETTFILITHDQEVAQQADRILEIKDGEIIMDLENL